MNFSMSQFFNEFQVLMTFPLSSNYKHVACFACMRGEHSKETSKMTIPLVEALLLLLFVVFNCE